MKSCRSSFVFYIADTSTLFGSMSSSRAQGCLPQVSQRRHVRFRNSSTDSFQQPQSSILDGSKHHILLEFVGPLAVTTKLKPLES